MKLHYQFVHIILHFVLVIIIFWSDSKSFSGGNRLAIGKCMEEFYVYFYIKDFQGGDISAKFSSSTDEWYLDDGCDNIPES